MVNIFGAEVPDIYIIFTIEIVGAVSFLLGYFIYTKNRFTAQICVKYLNTLKVVCKKKIKMNVDKFSWNDKDYNIDYGCAVIDNKGKPVIYWLKDYAQPINIFKDYKMSADSRTFKIVNDGKIISHAANRRVDRIYLYIIAGLIIVIAAIAIFALYNMNENNKELIILAEKLYNATKVTEAPVVIP